MRTGSCLVIVLLVSACVSLPEASYKMYPGPTRDGATLSIVRLGDVSGARIDGRIAQRSDWSEVQLLPGEHTIAWGTDFFVSALIEPDGIASGGREERVVLEPGHTYTLRADRTTGFGYRMYFWIRDETAQRVVAGEKLP